MSCPCQRRHAWTEEHAVLAVMIEASASGQRQARGHGDVVLAEDAGHEEVIVESRHVVRRVGGVLERESRDPGLSTGGSTDGRFAKRRVVPIPLEDLAELMIVTLSCECRTCGHDVP